MIVYIRLRLRALLKERTVLLLLIILAISAFLPTRIETYNYYDIEYYKDLQSYLLESDAANAYDTAPDALKLLVNREKQLLRDIVSSNRTGDRQTELESMLGYELVLLDNIRAGWLIGTSEEIHETKARFLTRLLESGHYDIYSAPSEMPSSYYAAACLLYLPSFLLFLPAVVVFSLIVTVRRGSEQNWLEKSIPLTHFKLVAANIFVGLLGTLAVHLLAVLPVLVYSTLRNGFGYLDYPVVDYRNGGICDTTVGGFLASFCSLIALGSLFIGMIACLVSRFSGSRTSVVVILAVLVVLPGTSQFIDIATKSDYANLIPLTYLNYEPVIGNVSHYPSLSKMNVTILSGVGVLSAWIVALALAIAMSYYHEGLIDRLRGGAYLIDEKKKPKGS